MITQKNAKIKALPIICAKRQTPGLFRRIGILQGKLRIRISAPAELIFWSEIHSVLRDYLLALLFY